MEKVLGFGGFFFRAKDPVALAHWYEQNLGIDRTPPDYAHAYWVADRGPVVFQPFPQDTAFFGDTNQQYMLNFRVADVNAMADQLRAAGVEVEVDIKEYSNGRFARFRDPEGNRVQLWQPKGDELTLPRYVWPMSDRH